MPELPEVETVRIGLSRLLPGKTIIGVENDWMRSFPNDSVVVNEFLINSEVSLIRRRGKVIIIELDSNYSLVIHLKMTGQLVYRSSSYSFGAGHPNDSLVGKLPDKSTRVTLSFNDNSHLFFNDQRKFGWMKFMPTIEVPNIDFFKKIGPEPLEPEFTSEVLALRLKRRPNTSIKAALLDQTVLAGIGNIYADESLWATKIHPATLVKNVSKASIVKLHAAIQEVLRLSIEKGGSTDKNYVDAEGKKGSYLKIAKVFRLEGQPCPRCGTTIIKTRVAGRGTHLCPKCQRLKK
jgi:formamidopyrimidine-DNA glycosylase